MKKFLSILFLYTLVVGLVFLSVNGLFLYRDTKSLSTMDSIKNNTSTIKDVPDKIDICNFGSSHGLFNFDYSSVSDLTCFNFALPSQSLSYDYRIFTQFEEHIKPGSTVYFIASHFSFFGDTEQLTPEFEARNNRYYKFLSNDLIKEYDIKTDILVNHFPSLNTDFFLSSFKNVLADLLAPSVQDAWNITTNPDKAATHAEERYRTFVSSKLDSQGNRMRNTENIDALYQMILRCKERDIHPILITTPYLTEYTAAVENNDPAFYSDFYGIIDTIVADTAIEYYDYSRDTRFSGKYELFTDSDHLNRDGALMFTKILLDETYFNHRSS